MRGNQRSRKWKKVLEGLICLVGLSQWSYSGKIGKANKNMTNKRKLFYIMLF